MAELLDDIGVYLNAQGVADLSGASGTLAHIHLGMMRDNDGNRVLALIARPGLPPLDTIGSGIGRILIRPRLMVVSRWDAEDYQGSLTLARAAWSALAGVANQTINGSYYVRIEALDEPALIERDPEERAIFSCNFQVTRSYP